MPIQNCKRNINVHLSINNFNYSNRVSVRLGEYDITSNEDCLRRGKVFSCAPPPINVPVEKTIVHRRYTSDDKNRRYDIGLIRLKYDVDYTGTFKQ